MLARSSEPEPGSRLFAPEELRLLACWFGEADPAEAARLLRAWRRPAPDALAAPIEVAVATLLLERLPLRMPGLGAALRAERGPDGALRFVLRRNDALGDPGLHAPLTREALALRWSGLRHIYGLTPVPGTARVALTLTRPALAERGRASSCAIGWAGADEDMLGALERLLLADWRRRRDAGRRRWSTILPGGFLTPDVATSWAERVWPGSRAAG